MTADLNASDIDWGPLSPIDIEPADDDPLVAALLEAMSYRTLAQEAIHALAAVTADRDRLERRHLRLLAERAGR